jgi:hypothetical protein
MRVWQKVAQLNERLDRLERQGQKEQIQEQVKTFRGSGFIGEGILEIEEFMYQLMNQIVMQGIDKDKQRIMVLILGVEGTVSIWIRQRRMLHLDEDFSTLMQALTEV